MFTYISAVFFLIITPGPGVLTTAGIGSGFGYRAGLRFLVGLFIGTNLVMIAVALGLTAIMFSVPELRIVFLGASVAWFLYLAAKIALAGARIGFIEADHAPGMMHGIGLQLINPKAYSVNNLLIAGYPFWPDSLFIEIVLKTLFMNMVWIPVHLIWLAAGVSVRRMELGARTQRLINYGMACSLVIVVLLAAFTA